MHYVSHAYHSISDLMIDMGRDAPRELRAAPTPPLRQPTAVFQQAIPVQVCDYLEIIKKYSLWQQYNLIVLHYVLLIQYLASVYDVMFQV